MWDAYMGAPWTRDATVRAYVVTMAPEVTGRIVELSIVNNGNVHKGDLLMVIDLDQQHDRRQSGRGSCATGRGERAEHRGADRLSSRHRSVPTRDRLIGRRQHSSSQSSRRARYGKLAQDG